MDIDSEEFEKEVDELVEWSENLNFDNYIKDWYVLSTSQGSGDFVPKLVNTSDHHVP
jgi:hypothetical protein